MKSMNWVFQDGWTRVKNLAGAITEREVQTKRQVGVLQSPPYNSSTIQAHVAVNLNRLCR
jgi:hypothetical protein